MGLAEGAERLEVAEALRQAGAEHVFKDDEWCAMRAREATDEEDRETFSEGMPSIAQSENVDPELMPRVASAIELAGDVTMFFDGEGRYLGLSTYNVMEIAFHPRGRGIDG